LWLKIYARGQVRLGTDTPVARYYLHDQSTCARYEHTAAFRFEDIQALLDVYQWLCSQDLPPARTEAVRDRIIGKYLHYCSYVKSLEHQYIANRLGASACAALALPSLLLMPRFWRETLRMWSPLRETV
jgi:hypothetical protein